MATKRLSLRAQARLKRENRELRERLQDLLTGSCPGTIVSTITPNETTYAEIETAHRLGFMLIVRKDSRSIALHAVKRAT